jgi:Group II intron, maturase-specific domain
MMTKPLDAVLVNFLPAIGDDERNRIARVIRRWRLHRWSGSILTDLAEAINAEVQAWINFYGRFYRSELVRLLIRINEYLIRWARWKYKRLRRYPAKARRLLAAVFRREPGLSPTGGSARVPTVGRWEPDELRGSRPVVCAVPGYVEDGRDASGFACSARFGGVMRST